MGGRVGSLGRPVPSCQLCDISLQTRAWPLDGLRMWGACPDRLPLPLPRQLPPLPPPSPPQNLCRRNRTEQEDYPGLSVTRTLPQRQPSLNGSSSGFLEIV